MKTITIDTYTPWGTTSAICVELHYRGKKLHQITAHKGDRERLMQLARKWAKNQGFTHVHLIGTPGKEMLK